MKEKWQKLPMWGKGLVLAGTAVAVFLIVKKVMKKKA